MVLDAPAHPVAAPEPPPPSAPAASPPDLLAAIGDLIKGMESRLETRLSWSANSMREETRNAIVDVRVMFESGIADIQHRMVSLERLSSVVRTAQAQTPRRTPAGRGTRRQRGGRAPNGPASLGKPEPLELPNALSPASDSPIPAHHANETGPASSRDAGELPPSAAGRDPDGSVPPTGDTLPGANAGTNNGDSARGPPAPSEGPQSAETPSPDFAEGAPGFVMQFGGPSTPPLGQIGRDVAPPDSDELALALQAVVPDTPLTDVEYTGNGNDADMNFASPLPAAATFSLSTPNEANLPPVSPGVGVTFNSDVIEISDNDFDNSAVADATVEAPEDLMAKSQAPAQRSNVMTDAQYASQMTTEHAELPASPEMGPNEPADNGEGSTFETTPRAQQRKLPEGLAMSEPVPSSKVGGKRKRTSLPFNNSMSKRQNLFKSPYKDLSSDEEEDEDEDVEEYEIDRGDAGLSEGEEPIASQPFSPSPSAEASASQGVQRSPGSGSVVRPLPIPAVGVPQSDIDIRDRIREADEICATFCSLENAGNPKHALELYLSAANANSVVGMVRVGYMYLKGAKSLQPGTTKVRRNRKAAQSWATRALTEDPNNPEALNLRGELWESSTGKHGLTFKKALECYSKSANMGNEVGMYLKGKLWFAYMDKATNESRRRKCAENIVKELSKAIDHGSGDAASLLGNVYENDECFPAYKHVLKNHEGTPDYDATKRALELYWLGMNRGSARGTNDVAACYEVAYSDLIGNFDMAKKFYTKAFETGHIGAASNLALLYELGGKGVYAESIDTEEALRWYNIGHAMDSPSATYYLGCVYDTGSIAQESKLLAEKYFKASINFAESCKEELDFVGKASAELFALYATSIILDDEYCPRFLKALKERGKRERFNPDSEINKVRKDLGTVISASCDPGSASEQAQASARERAKERLGPKNYEAIMKRAKLILRNISSARQANADTTEEVECLGRIVGQGGIAKLGLHAA